MNVQIATHTISSGGKIKNEVLKALSDLQYGQLVIMIKDGKVIQIDKTEKRRLPRIEGLNGEGI